MGALFPPIVSEFETEEQASSYDRWFKAKVQAAIDDSRPGVAHDDVMAEMDAIILRLDRSESLTKNNRS